jgi:demethylmenaquinone methyltransferase/2-methoxy-6-polyprenyl-1,4-benzoquinol methylase
VLVHHRGHAVAKKFFNAKTAPSYDSIVRLTTFGRDAAWKNHILVQIKNKKKILDLACGTGILSELVRNAQKRDAVVGLDLTFEYLQVARQKKKKNENHVLLEPKAALLVQATAEAVPHADKVFDAIISSYLAKYVDLKTLVNECWRVLDDGGVAVFHDFTCPQSPAMWMLWRFYFLILGTAGRVFAPSWKEVFCDLDSVICDSKWMDALPVALKERGFVDIVSSYYTFGTAGMVVAKKP